MVAPLQAQSDDSAKSDNWQFAAAVYLWGAGIGGQTQRGKEVSVDFSTLVDNLEMGFMGAFEARKGKWSLLTDVIYLDVGGTKSTEVSIPADPEPPITAIASADLEMEGLVVLLAGSYNLLATDRSRLDLVAGARNLDLDMDLVLSVEALGPGKSIALSQEASVWDAVIGVKGNLGLGQRWYLPYAFDIGTGDSDLTWQALGGVSFRAASWVDLVLAYRHLEWDLGSDSLIADINFSGPAFGAIFRF